MSMTYSSHYARQVAPGPFRLLRYVPDEAPFEDQDLAAHSQQHGEIFYLAEQDNVGFFHYEHWQGGQLIRRLKYNSDYHWLSVAGEPEPWEHALIFTEDILGKTLQGYDQESHEAIRSAWGRKCIQQGDAFPIRELVEILGGMRRHLNLTDGK